MKNSKTLIGLRTIKTVTAVFITLVLARWVSILDIFIMSTTSIITLKPTKEKTLLVGAERILGTLVGGTLGLVLLLTKNYIPHYDSVMHIFIIPIFILVLILICNLIKQSESIGISSIVFFRIITGFATSGTNVFFYVIIRVISSIIGVLVSLILNSIEKYKYIEMEIEADRQKLDMK